MLYIAVVLFQQRRGELEFIALLALGLSLITVILRFRFFRLFRLLRLLRLLSGLLITLRCLFLFGEFRINLDRNLRIMP